MWPTLSMQRTGSLEAFASISVIPLVCRCTCAGSGGRYRYSTSAPLPVPHLAVAAADLCRAPYLPPGSLVRLEECWRQILRPVRGPGTLRTEDAEEECRQRLWTPASLLCDQFAQGWCCFSKTTAEKSIVCHLTFVETSFLIVYVRSHTSYKILFT